tara:strand:+ start:5986 stop:7368 length:1383 start_codon:yes stop_codon:yes gene_type:complete
MNVLQRRMFSNGGDVNISSEMQTYLDEIGVDPTGKTVDQIKSEVDQAIQDEYADYSKLLFDPSDPLDYVSLGLMATGVGAGVGTGIKALRKGKKIQKIAQMIKQARERAAKIFRENPITSTAIAGGVAVPLVDVATDFEEPPDMVPPENITAELADLTEQERIKKQNQSKKQREVDAARAAKDEKDKINETLRILQTRAGEFDEAEKERISQERRDNAFTLMQEIGSAMVETGQIDRGLALGATRASKRISEEKLAEELAKKEAQEKLAEESKLSESDYLKITERYQESARTLSKQKNLERIIQGMEQAISTGNVSGARGAIGRLIDDVAGFSGIGDDIVGAATKAVADGRYLEAQAIQEILQESGRTISDRDRDLIRQMMANLESLFTGKGEALDALSKVKINIRDAMQASKSDIDALKSRYGDKIPELSNYDRIYSINPQTREVDEDDAVLQADEIDV